MTHAPSPALSDLPQGGRLVAYDLDDKGRLEAHDAARASRAIEAALDPQGLSTIARALVRIRGR